MIQALRILILRKGFIRQGEFARYARVNEARLSKIINQQVEPSARERAAFERVLGEEVKRIFPAE